eukprot:14366465-Heterocapsa_arctica.AAC.1
MEAILVLYILCKNGKQMVRHAKDFRAEMVEDQHKPWDENMNKLADWFQQGNENSQWEKQQFHDKKWKYRKK